MGICEYTVLKARAAVFDHRRRRFVAGGLDGKHNRFAAFAYARRAICGYFVIPRHRPPSFPCAGLPPPRRKAAHAATNTAPRAQHDVVEELHGSC
jgi:hypothetical protein